MAFININTQEYPFSENDIKGLNPNTSFATPFSHPDYAVVFEPARPQFDETTQKLVEQSPQIIEGTWTQQWQVVSLTQEEIDTRVQSARADALNKAQTITMRQARLALLQNNLLDTVNTAVTSLSQEAQITWEYATEVQRQHPMVLEIAAGLNMSEEQMDDLFILAGTL